MRSEKGNVSDCQNGPWLQTIQQGLCLTFRFNKMQMPPPAPPLSPYVCVRDERGNSQRGRDTSRVQIESFRARSERTACARSGAKPQSVRELGRGVKRTEIQPVVPIQIRRIEEEPDVAPSGTVLLH
ncbi:hypothetical protein Q7C36_013484 [Tachysurus vachellii]|uniref:Uncharacterized protein n=1 Tax=Tachysurus vachellii TaxID=175792 RepID=A0AA88MIV9_TACVA|nr:hypothetical protein Q7C36_013484 [Tachysurus vachellii]